MPFGSVRFDQGDALMDVVFDPAGRTPCRVVQVDRLSHMRQP